MRTTPKLTHAELSKRFKYEDGELYRKKGDTYERVTSTTSVSVGYHAYSKGAIIYTLLNAKNEVGAGMKIDHIDGDINNNSPDNLTPITAQEYEANKAQGKYYNGAQDGAVWNRRIKMYTVVKQGKLIGRFKRGDEAQQAYEGLLS